MSFFKSVAVFSAIIGFAFFQQANAQYSVSMPYKQVSVENNNGRAVFNGAPLWGESGQPALPQYSVSILIPSDIDFKDVSVGLVNLEHEDLAEPIEVAPCNPIYKNNRPVWGKNQAMIVDGKDTSVFNKNVFFPENFIGAVSFGKMYEYKIVYITIYPYLYNPMQKKLRKLTGGDITVSFPTKKKSKAAKGKRAGWVENQLTRNLANPQALETYGVAVETASLAKTLAAPLVSTTTFVIITTNEIRSGSTQFPAFKAFLETKYDNVIVATQTDYDAGTPAATADARARKIRQWLKDNKVEATWHYVLLIGNPDHASGDVPMKEHLSNYGEHNGTDYYFAELSGDWDAGEIDRDPELAVGRIPVYTDPATGAPNFTKLNRILLKTENYEKETNVEWRRFALLPVVPLFSWNDYPFAESIINTTLKPDQWQYRRLYEPYNYLYFKFVENLSNMSVISEVPFCSEALVTANWNTFDPGIVAWHTHGHNGVAVGVLNSYPSSYGTVRLLNDLHPAIVFSASCLTSNDQDSNNLGSETVYYNAVAYVGGTAELSDDFVDWAGPEFVKNIVTGKTSVPMSVGDAMRDLYSTNPGDYSLTLYGCPDVALNLQPVGASPAPQSISAQTISSSQIDLSWPAVIPAPNKYFVYRGDASATRVAGFSPIAQVIAPTTTYQDLSLNPGLKYKYRVCAVDNSGSSSGYSPVDSAATLTSDNSSLLPGMVSGLTATPGCYQATLNWTGDPKATSYNIKRSRAASGPFVTIYNLAATTYTDINLLNAINYYYAVSAVNEFGQSADFPDTLNEYKVTPQLADVNAGPMNPMFNNVKHNSFEYCWTNNTINDVLKIAVKLSYTKYVAGDSFDVTATVSNPRDFTSNRLLDLDDDQLVSFKVMATNEYGSTAWTIDNRTTTTTGTKPGVPINFSIAAVTPELLTVSWSPAPSGPTTDGYQIYHHALGSSDTVFTLIGEYNSTTTSIPINTCEATTDSFSIRAFHVDADGKLYSQYSPKFVFTTSPWPLLAPSNLVAASTSANQIKLMWTDNLTTETGFSIWRRDVTAKGNWVEIFTTATNVTQYLDVSVASDNNYEYRIRAKCTAAPGFSVWEGPVEGSTKVLDNTPGDFPLFSGATSSTKINLDWYYGLSNVIYTIQWSTLHPNDPNAPPPEASFQTLATQPYNLYTYLKTGLTPGVTYWFRVKAQNWVGSNNTWAMTCSKTGPQEPTDLSAVAVSGSQVNLSWTDHADDETGFTIEYNIPADGVDWSEKNRISANITTNSVCNLQANTTYKFRVRADNKYGVSARSNEVTVTTPSDPCIAVLGGRSGSPGTVSGTAFGLAPPWAIGSEYCKSTDGDINTYYDYSQANSGYTGLDFGFPVSIGKIRFYPRDGYASRMIGGKFQGSNTSSYSGFVDMYTITTTPSVQWNVVILPNPTAYQYVRYLAPDGGYGNITEMEFYEQYMITASAGTTRGSISPSGSLRMDGGANQTFTITPNSGNQIDVVWVDGKNKGSITSYEFLDGRTNHTIFATFKSEAENATLSGGASTSTSGSRYSGTGYVDGFCNSTTAQVTFTENVTSAGSYEVNLRYSAGNGTSTTTGLYVNGVKIRNITCPATADWNTWADQAEMVTLNAGTNTIKYKAETMSTNCIHLDFVSFLYTGGGLTYTIAASAGPNGSISPSGNVAVTSFGSKNFTITPNSGCQIDDVIVDGTSWGSNSSQTLYDVTSNHTILATFKKEAESAALSGSAITAASGSGYSGTGYVDGFCNSNTAQVTFTENVTSAGSYKIKLRYSAGSGTNSTTGLYVNGVKIKNITCPTTADWDTWADEVETVTLNAGTNTITYKAEMISTICINLDYISLLYVATFTWEAEDAILSGGANKNTNHSGYSGTGFVDGFWENSTAKVTFAANVAYGGNYEVKLRYSAGNGTSTTTGLYVNGVKIKNITCPATADWNTWADEVETVTLNAGTNTITYKVEMISAICINLDKLALASVTTPSPVAVQVYMRDQTLGSNQQTQPRFYIQNTGTIPLSNFTMKYYFTVENEKTPVIENYYMSSYPGTLQHISGNDWCVVVTFSGTLAADGGRIPQNDGYNFGLHYSYWENVWNQGNNFSQPVSSSSYDLNGKVAIFNSSNELVYGSMP